MASVMRLEGLIFCPLREMLQQFTEVRGMKRYIFTVPLNATRFSSYWVNLITSTSFRLAKQLIDSMKKDVIQKPMI